MTLQTILFLAIGAGALFVMMRFGCGAHAMGHNQGGHPHSGTTELDHNVVRNESGKAVDPICGMTVDIGSAETAVQNGTTYYFCSASCRDKFQASPDAHAGAAADAPRHGSHRHGCC